MSLRFWEQPKLYSFLQETQRRGNRNDMNWLSSDPLQPTFVFLNIWSPETRRIYFCYQIIQIWYLNYPSILWPVKGVLCRILPTTYLHWLQKAVLFQQKKLAFHDKAGLIFKCHGLIKVTNYGRNASFRRKRYKMQTSKRKISLFQVPNSTGT